MVRQPRPEVRQLLIERAAGMLARREPMSLRSLVAGTGVSTMAVYTYFDGMSGLLGAVRQAGFIRLEELLATLTDTDDPVSDLAAMGGAYWTSALRQPDLYRLMFDGTLPLPDPLAADATFDRLTSGAARAVADGRFGAHLVPADFARELWLLGHGGCMLVAGGVLGAEPVEATTKSALGRLYLAAGDDALLAERSLARGWARGCGGT